MTAGTARCLPGCYETIRNRNSAAGATAEWFLGEQSPTSEDGNAKQQPRKSSLMPLVPDDYCPAHVLEPIPSNRNERISIADSAPQEPLKVCLPYRLYRPFA